MYVCDHVVIKIQVKDKDDKELLWKKVLIIKNNLKDKSENM